ncbi:unnamed protein product [Rotaria sp. Silwood1]|nr:unnamed protein product [Rotaria sp. Silwood1]
MLNEHLEEQLYEIQIQWIILKNLYENDIKQLKQLITNIRYGQCNISIIDKILSQRRRKNFDDRINRITEKMNNITTPGQVITDLKLSSNKDSGEKKISKKEENVSSTSDITNILLLGETGVGKSTFINAFANYLTFNTLEEAQRNEPVVLMPVSFLMTTGDNFEEHIVKFGDIDDSNNEDFDHPGQSVTQHCKAYVFYLNGTDQQKLRIIDTPGFGDTRGIEQDDLNMEPILEYVNNLSHLNAICFLLKPNASRLNISFRSCITHLLSQFNVD